MLEEMGSKIRRIYFFEGRPEIRMWMETRVNTLSDTPPIFIIIANSADPEMSKIIPNDLYNLNRRQIFTRTTLFEILNN